MVIFRELSLTDAAPAKITDVIVGAAGIKTESRNNPISRGERFARKKYSPRRIVIMFKLPMNTPVRRADWMQAISDWAAGDEPGQLKIPHYPGRYIDAVCSTFPDFAAVEQREIMEIEFTAFDPAFVSDEEHIYTCGIPFAVGGNVPAMAYIKAVNAAPVTDPAWTLDGVKTIRLSGSVGTGTVIIDLEEKNVLLNDTPINDMIILSSRFFELKPGVHTVTGAGAVCLRERWV